MYRYSIARRPSRENTPYGRVAPLENLPRGKSGLLTAWSGSDTGKASSPRHLIWRRFMGRSAGVNTGLEGRPAFLAKPLFATGARLCFADR